VPLIEQRDDRYLRSPLLRREAGELRLYLIAWQGDAESVLRFTLDDDGAPRGKAEEVERHPAILQLAADTGVPAAVTVDASEDAAACRGWAARVVRANGVSEVIAAAPGGRSVCAFRGRGIAAAPALAARAAGGGIWLAFHHDIREETGEPDVSKWVAVRLVDDEMRVYEPSADDAGRDRDREGEEQGFEFPTVAVGTDGAVSIFGRGSHCFWRQDLNAAGFSERRALGDGTWGCRGRRVAVCDAGDGTLMTARRERGGIVVQRVPAPAGGAPELRESVGRGEHASVTAPVAGGDGNDGVARPDPAARYGLRTLFGDIHQHSAHSDGCGTADEPFLRARYVYGDDFCALSDHESFLGKRTGPGEWKYLQEAAERHDDPGRFATLFAYEWTARAHPGPGHKVVYFDEIGKPLLSRDAFPEGKELVAAVSRAGGFAAPHHVGWTGADEAGHRAGAGRDAQPVWEICSCHGCDEYAGHPLGQRGDNRDQLVEVMLEKGLRFGFVGGSDSHGLVFHHGIARKRDPFRTGLTAVQARACTRRAVFEAVRKRRCYATSGAKILLDFVVGDSPMGSVVRRGEPLSALARAVGTTSIKRLSLVGPVGVVASVEPGAPSAEIAYTVTPGGPDADFLYARVEQADGEWAWSSPVFLER
jgi:hypothetical protein